jgi:hypothetical protein
VAYALEADDDNLKKDRDTRLFFEQATRKLFKHRYAPVANFSSQNQQVYQGLGAFGTGPLFIDQAVDVHGRPIRAIRYKACPLGRGVPAREPPGLDRRLHPLVPPHGRAGLPEVGGQAPGLAQVGGHGAAFRDAG